MTEEELLEVIEQAAREGATELDLSGKELTVLPPEIGKLTGLRKLILGKWEYDERGRIRGAIGNNLTALPKEIGQLEQLEELLVIRNQLSSLPAEIAGLTQLQSLDLSDNQLTALPEAIAQLTQLQSLHLSVNQLTALPEAIRQLPNLKKLDLRQNPLPIPPEILGEKNIFDEPGDVQEILDFYFRILDPNETELLYEAKFLIVGEGGAGKTSLAKKLKDETYSLQPNEQSTEGIEVIRWDIPHPDGGQFRINIWDFGGQEIYHHTHQFFLTKRSLYALVADSRENNTDFYYWLKVVELLSDNSPALIIKNEKQDRSCEINDRHLRGQFKNLKEIFATNLATNRGLTEIKQAIQYHIAQLPHVGDPLPKVWVRVRAALENNVRNYINLAEYERLCEINGITDRKDKLRLSSYLHDLGVCLHFQDDIALKNTVILKPEWGTTAVYKVLDTKKVEQNFGCFTQQDLDEIWEDVEYNEMRDELLHLMMRFKLCYEIPGRPHTYIAPELLSVKQAEYDWDESKNLILRYEYEFMPKGILTRFIVEMHRWIEEQQLVWKNGVVLKDSRARAEIIEDYRYHKGEIKIRVCGTHKKEMLSIIDHEFYKIHSSYDRLNYDTFIPCNCPICEGNQNPHSYPLKTLRQFLNDKQYDIQCQKSYRMVNVRGLLDDIGEPATRLDNPRTPGDDDKAHIKKPSVEQMPPGTPPMTEEQKKPPRVKSSWANGSFYLCTVVVVIFAIRWGLADLPFYVFALSLVAAILIVPLIGAFQLRQDDRLSERSFLKLIRMAFEQLPLIKNIIDLAKGNSPSNRTSGE